MAGGHPLPTSQQRNWGKRQTWGMRDPTDFQSARPASGMQIQEGERFRGEQRGWDAIMGEFYLGAWGGVRQGWGSGRPLPTPTSQRILGLG